MTIRVSPKTNAAVNILVSEMKAAQPGTRITQDDAIWQLIREKRREIADRVEELSPKSEQRDDQQGGKPK